MCTRYILNLKTIESVRNRQVDFVCQYQSGGLKV